MLQAWRTILALYVLAWVAGPLGAQDAQQQPLPTDPAGEPQEPRELPIVLEILVEGEERWSEQQLISALGQGVGERLDVKEINRGIINLWKAFHVRAGVEVAEEAGGVRLLLSVTEMASDREPRFIGNVHVDTNTLEQWTLLEDQAEVFVHQAQRIRQRLLEGYHRKGYYFAEVDIVSRDEELGGAALHDVIFDIQEGPKVRVAGVVIQGNGSMPDRGFGLWKQGLSAFAKRKLKGPSLFNWKGNVFVEEILEADLLAMRKVYRDRGWLDVVIEVKQLDFNAARSRVKVVIQVDEGQPYTISGLDIEAVEYVNPARSLETRPAPGGLVFPRDKLLAVCESKAGERFEFNRRARDERELRDYYGDRGFIWHASLPREVRWEFLEPEIVRNVKKHTVAVYYRIVQGRKLTVREVRFAGHFHTRDKVLRREVSVFPGDLANLTEINRSLTRIHGTGYFSDQLNRLEHVEPTYRFIPVPGKPDQVDVEYIVEEGRVVDFNVTGGIDSNDGAFGLVSLTMHNFDITDTPSSFLGMWGEIFNKEAFHGAGQRLDIEVSPGTQITRGRVHFLEPDIFNRYLQPIALDLDFTKWVRLYDTHDEDRLTKSVKFARRFGFDTSASIGYQHADVEVSDLDSSGVPPLLAAQESLGSKDLGGITLDLNNRSLDNLILPRKGYRLSFNNIVYDKAFLSDFEFLKSEVHWDLYQPTGRKADGTKPVLHVEIDAGVAQPWGDTDDVPYSDRFFTGGARSLRGFEFRGVGPNDPVSGFALGGETYLSGSLEWQYPLHSIVQPGTYRRIESVRGQLFLDFGILDEDPFALDLGELRASVGFGVGLAYPIPLILNFGFPIQKGDGDDTQVFSFGLSLR
jgi:outer membrane protein insertion porin family